MPTTPVTPKLPDPPLKLPDLDPGTPIDPTKVPTIAKPEPEVELYDPPALKNEPEDITIADASAGEEQANAS